MSVDIKLRREILHLLDILPPYDRDLRTIVIGCNLNHYKGTDKDIRPLVIAVLNELAQEGLVEYTKHVIQRDVNHQFKTIRIYSLKK